MSKKNGAEKRVIALPPIVRGNRRGTTSTISLSLPVEIADELRAAGDALSGRPNYLNMTRITAEALARYFPELRKLLNDGKPFKFPSQGLPSRRGRPVKHPASP